MVAHPQYAPVYRLTIQGQDLPAPVRACVQSVSYEDGLNGADQVQISLANPNLRFLQEHIRGFGGLTLPTGIAVNGLFALDAVPRGLFDLSNKITLALGYAPDPPAGLFLGEITGVAASFPSSGMPTLNITAHDFLERAGRGSASRGFGPLPDAAIVEILALENGLLAIIDPYMFPLDAVNTIGNVLFGTATRQTGQSDLALLQQIAARYDMQLNMDVATLYLTRFLNREFTPRLTLTYGQTLLDFTPRLSSVGQTLGVSQRVALREIRIDLLLRVFWDMDRESLGITILPAQAAVVAGAAAPGGAPAADESHRTIRNAIDVANTVVSMIHDLREKLNTRLTGSGSALGDPRLRAGALIRLDGLGVDFSGNYRVTRATHTLDTNGYRTNFDVQREVIP